MSGEQDILLRVDNLTQIFSGKEGQVKAVDGISFSIRRGEVFGLVGESGCGKTTTGRSIIRLYDITGGSVYFGGQRICAGTLSYREEIGRAKARLNERLKSIKESTDSEKKAIATQAKGEYHAVVRQQRENIRRARYDHIRCNAVYAAAQTEKVKAHYLPLISEQTEQTIRNRLEREYRAQIRLAKKRGITTKMQMIFQDPVASLDPRMTVREIIAEGLVIRGVRDKKEIDRRVYRTLEMVGLVPEHAGRYPHEFSGGQRQRIGIARAVILNPELIIADEPVSALDVSIQAQVINLLDDLRKKLGLTVLFIAHDLSVVKYFSDTIGVMYMGKMVEIAPSDELFTHPLHPYTKSLLSAIPVPDPLAERQRKRIVYNPVAEHDYRTDTPQMREINVGHFVYCNQAEYDKYRVERQVRK